MQQTKSVTQATKSFLANKLEKPAYVWDVCRSHWLHLRRPPVTARCPRR